MSWKQGGKEIFGAKKYLNIKVAWKESGFDSRGILMEPHKE